MSLVFKWHGHTADDAITQHGSTLKETDLKFSATITIPFLCPCPVYHNPLLTCWNWFLTFSRPSSSLGCISPINHLSLASPFQLHSHEGSISHLPVESPSLPCIFPTEVPIPGMLSHAGEKWRAAVRAIPDSGSPIICTFRAAVRLSHSSLVSAFLTSSWCYTFLQGFIPPLTPFHCRCSSWAPHWK